MAIAIAYALIGLVMAVGLISDRWSTLNFQPWDIRDWIALVMSTGYVVAFWPTLMGGKNMRIT